MIAWCEASRGRLGDDVAAIVEACSDSLDSGDRRSWRVRKKTIDDQLWYHRALLRFFSARQPGPLVEDLRRDRRRGL